MKAESRDVRSVGERVEQLLAELDRIAEPAVAAKAEDLVRALMELYGAGLARIGELLSGTDEGAAALRTLAADELVGGLLVLHDLHPDDTATRVAGALDRVRPYLGSHAGDVDLLGIDGDVVRLRLAGNCDGCPSSTVTVKLAIEAAIESLAPEIAGVEVEGVAAPPATTPAGPDGRTLLPLAMGTPVAEEPPAPAPSWVDVPAAADLPAGTVRAVRVAGQGTVVCRVGDDLYAYRNGCPACGGDLAAGTLTGTTLACPRCAGRYDVRLAGRGERGHLDPLPLLSEAGRIRVAVPNLVAS